MTEARCNPLQAGIARLYHYEKFCEGWLATTLREQKIYCSDPDKLNDPWRSEEHTSELQSLRHLVCRLLLEKKKRCASMSALLLFGALLLSAALTPSGRAHRGRRRRGAPPRMRREGPGASCRFFFLKDRPPPEIYPLPHPAPLRN